MALNNAVMSGPVNLTTNYAVVLDIVDANLAPCNNLFCYNPSTTDVIYVIIDSNESAFFVIPPSSARTFAASDGFEINQNVKAKGLAGAINNCYFEMWQASQ